MQNEDKNPHTLTPAATLILTRQHSGELQIYLIRRSLKSGFMAGNYVFPGGRVDLEDRNFKVWQPRVDLDRSAMMQKLGGDLTAAEALAYGVAAIREAFEEAGVFLGHRYESNPDDLKRICQLRLTADLPSGWLQNLAVAENWTLTLSSLSRWSHWITPERMKRRYDTRFFMATMPTEQICRVDGRETTHGFWISPEKGLAGNLAGEIPLSPPTLITLHELLQYASQQDLAKETEGRLWGEALRPRMIPLDKGAVILEPWDPLYSHTNIEIDPVGLRKAVLPIGQSFSRIWHHQGIWRPVGN
jgi:8-oxo-dGTP pyrophosphatase MutT (NUDIX family)